MKKLMLFTLILMSNLISLDALAKKIQFKNKTDYDITLTYTSDKIKASKELGVVHRRTSYLHDLNLEDLTSLTIRGFGPLAREHDVDLNKLKKETPGCENPIVTIGARRFGLTYDTSAHCPRKIEEGWEIIGHNGK